MLSSHLIGVLFALASALSWGIGDFSGGLATRRNNQFQVLMLVSLTGLVAFVLLALVKGEPLPSIASSIWAACAGVSGAIGIAALYLGLSLGNVAIVAPTGAVIGAGIPVLFAIFLQGLPSLSQVAGFMAGICGIWLVTGSSSAMWEEKRRGFSLAVAAGVGFGGFFVLITQVESETIFAPLAIAKAIALVVAVALLVIRRMNLTSPARNPAALLAGLLDAGGNLFYLMASTFTRLDVAAVLSCMAPAITVLLANRILHERVSQAQWLGVTLCATAVALIAL